LAAVVRVVQAQPVLLAQSRELLALIRYFQRLLLPVAAALVAMERHTVLDLTEVQEVVVETAPAVQEILQAHLPRRVVMVEAEAQAARIMAAEAAVVRLPLVLMALEPQPVMEEQEPHLQSQAQA
jgi:hypothetical protein